MISSRTQSGKFMEYDESKNVFIQSLTTRSISRHDKLDDLGPPLLHKVQSSGKDSIEKKREITTSLVGTNKTAILWRIKRYSGLLCQTTISVLPSHYRIYNSEYKKEMIQYEENLIKSRNVMSEHNLSV